MGSKAAQAPPLIDTACREGFFPSQYAERLDRSRRHWGDIHMIRKALFAAAILLAPAIASAQTPEADAARAAQAAADAAWPKTGPTPPLPVAETLPKMFKVILIGDSTMQPNSGWGGAFCAYHVNFSITCVNMAKGGRSTSNYRA